MQLGWQCDAALGLKPGTAVFGTQAGTASPFWLRWPRQAMKELGGPDRACPALNHMSSGCTALSRRRGRGTARAQLSQPEPGAADCNQPSNDNRNASGKVHILQSHSKFHNYLSHPECQLSHHRGGGGGGACGRPYGSPPVAVPKLASGEAVSTGAMRLPRRAALKARLWRRAALPAA